MTNICKHCGLTLQGTDKEGEDICVDCLADLCFPSSYSTIEGCIRQSTDNPINNEQEEQSSSKASECDESEANKEETEQCQ